MFGYIKKTFLGLLTGLVNASNHTKCVSLIKQKCMTQPNLINLHPKKHIQELHYYPFFIKLGRCVRSCNSLNDFSDKVCVSDETEDSVLSVSNMITRINESETLTKHISCECKRKFDDRKCNSNQKCNNDKCICECKKHDICEKYYIWNPATCSYENGRYLVNIIDRSVITCDEIIDTGKKTVAKNFNKKKCILVAFLKISIALLIAVSIYCYLIKYQIKKHLLPFHVTNDKLINDKLINVL